MSSKIRRSAPVNVNSMNIARNVRWAVGAVVFALVLIFFWEPTMTYFESIFHKAAGVFHSSGK